MKILQVHNKYLNYGGEDAVVDNEYRLLTERGFEVEQLFFDNRSVSPIKSFHNKDSGNSISQKINAFKPDIVHVHNIFYSASPSVLIAAKKKGVPIIMTLHNFRLLCPGALFLRDGNVCTKCKDLKYPIYGVVHKCFQDSFGKSLVLASLLGVHNALRTWERNIDKFIVLTPFIKQLLNSSSLKLPKDKVIVKANSTDDLLLDENTVLKREGYLFIGRLSKEKGIDVLVEAFNKMPDLRLEVIGTGELEEVLKSKASANIIFHGRQAKDFIKNKLKTTRALVFPSIWYEGLPNTIIESFSSGTPVLASNMDNINQIVTKGYNGELFMPNDNNSIVEGIKQFNEQSSSSYYSNARATFEKKYTHESNFEEMSRIYTGLLSSKTDNPLENKG